MCQAALVWAVIGLFFLGKFLLRFWGRANVAALTVFAVAFGTNLYTYSITSFGLSHPLVFLLFFGLLYLHPQLAHDLPVAIPLRHRAGLRLDFSLPASRHSGLPVAGGLGWLNIYQSNQHVTQALPGDGITRAYYWRAWNRVHVNDETRQLLAH